MLECVQLRGDESGVMLLGTDWPGDITETIHDIT
jgi:hypothetical protein